MQTYELYVRGRSVGANSDDVTLVRTSIGVDSIHVMFDDAEWLSFSLYATFSQRGVSPVTIPIVASSIPGSPEWSAEASMLIPWQVITHVGPIYITFQGTDSSGNHIITAKGAPLTVEEAGDVALGDIPEDAPTVDQWNQAYSDAMAAINQVNSLIANLQSNIDGIVSDAEASIGQMVDSSYITATESRLGVIKVGEGLVVDDNGTLSLEYASGISSSQVNAIDNLVNIASQTYGIDISERSAVPDGLLMLASSLPIDNNTMTIDDDGKVRVALDSADTESF